VAQLVEALCYKTEGHGFDLEFFIAFILQPHYDSVIDSAFKRNDWQEYFLQGKGGCTFMCRLS
jgi:hypothetical protein